MRKHRESKEAEYANFLSHTGLESKSLHNVNFFEIHDFNDENLKNYDGFFIGGFSDDPSDTIELTEEFYPFIHSFEKILNRAITEKKPGLLSCGGFMIASVLLGGKIAIDTSMQEFDILPICLLEIAVKDPLFKKFPTQFDIVSGHMKSTISLPPNCILMGSSDRCPNHIFKIKTAPIYAFQGHPEISSKDLKDRVRPYIHKYFEKREEYEKFINRRSNTLYANSIPRRFVQLVNNGVFQTY